MCLSTTERIRRSEAPRHLWDRLNRSSQERYARLGRDFELHVERLLQQLVADQKIASCQRHEPRSDEDLAGKDFTIVTRAGATVSFGITRSARQCNEARARHRDVPQHWFPFETKDETIKRWVCDLAYQSDLRAGIEQLVRPSSRTQGGRKHGHASIACAS